MDDDVLGRNDCAVRSQVVGDVQQPGEERLVGGNPLCAHRVGRAARRQELGIESALGPDGHDDGVLDLLGLHKAQHLGAEVIAPIAPPQPAAGYRPEAQVHALDIDAPDEDFPIGLWRGQVGELIARHLEGDVGLGFPVRAGLIEIGPQDRADQKGHSAQHPVMIQAFNALQRLDDLAHHLAGGGLALLQLGDGRRVEFHLEQLQDQPGDFRVCGKRRHLHPLTGVQAGLLTVARQGPDQGCVAPGDRELHDKAIETVVFGATGPDRGHRLLEGALQVREHQVLATRILDLEIVDPHGVLTDPRHREAGFGQGLQPHVVQDRKNVGQRGGNLRAVELEAELQRVVALDPVGANSHAGLGVHRLDHSHVGQRFSAVESIAISGRERLSVAGQGGGDVRGLAPGGADGVREPVFPGARGLGDLGLDGRQVRLAMVPRRKTNDVVDPRERGLRKARV